MPLQVWLEKYIWPAEKTWLSPQFVYDGMTLACLEMIKGGITTFADMYFYGEELAQATKNMGMRGIIANNIFDFPTVVASNSDEYIAIADSFIKNWLHDDLVTPSIGPHAAYTCSPATLQKALAVAERYDVLLQIHLAETKTEGQDVLAKYNKRPTEHLEDLGIFNAKVLAAHCVWVNDTDIEILAKRRVGVAHCIKSNLKLASGIAPIPKMLQRGMKVSFGTDGAASNNSLDLLSEVTTAAKVHKAFAQDPTVLDAKTALRLATRGGAETLNMQDKIGSLEPGLRADLITIDLRQPHLVPLYNLYSQLVYAALASDVDTVMINGKLIMDQRKLINTNEAEILATANGWQHKIGNN
jgi:5-methylthioadenosine/S-adenosylhomocysteine deaminase